MTSARRSDRGSAAPLCWLSLRPTAIAAPGCCWSKRGSRSAPANSRTEWSEPGSRANWSGSIACWSWSGSMANSSAPDSNCLAPCYGKRWCRWSSTARQRSGCSEPAEFAPRCSSSALCLSWAAAAMQTASMSNCSNRIARRPTSRSRRQRWWPTINACSFEVLPKCYRRLTLNERLGSRSGKSGNSVFLLFGLRAGQRPFENRSRIRSSACSSDANRRTIKERPARPSAIRPHECRMNSE
jgi:hypothetical protein